jgi:6-phosphogluconolactonase
MSAMRKPFALSLSRLLLVVLLCGLWAQAAEPVYQVFVGTYTDKQQSKGIYRFRFNTADGKASAPELSAETENPSFLAVDPSAKHLYAVNEVSNRGKSEGGVTVFDIDGTRLKQTQEITSLGADPAYIAVDNSGHYVLVANYTGGNVAVFPIGKDGKLGDHSAFVQHKGSSVNKERQAGPHAHSIQMSRDNHFALSADLGLDEVLVYEFNPHVGTLTAANPAFAKVAPGAGPRHVAFSPDGKYVYVTNEMTSTVTVFAYNKRTGKMHEMQTVSTLPVDSKVVDNSTAEITVDRKGKYLYVSNRGEDSIAQFSIEPMDGKLTFVHRIPTGGKMPRFFTLDPTGKWMFAANQETNDIFVFKVDEESGRLTPTGQKIEIGAPVSLVFVPMR